jgi:hypothetical protein
MHRSVWRGSGPLVRGHAPQQCPLRRGQAAVEGQQGRIILRDHGDSGGALLSGTMQEFGLHVLQQIVKLSLSEVAQDHVKRGRGRRTHRAVSF